MYFITTKRMLEVCFFQHTPTFIIEPLMQSMSKERSTRTGDMPEMVLQVYFEVSTSLSLRYSARL